MCNRQTEVGSKTLASMVMINPESLSPATDPRSTFYYVDISSVANGRLHLPMVPIAYQDAPSRARRIIRHGDVLMSTVRPNLKAFAFCSLPDGNFVASTGFAVLRAASRTDACFILYCLLNDETARQIERYTVGSNYPAINARDVGRLSIPDFSPGQQREIAEILVTLDDVIVQTEALIAKTQQIKLGLVHDLFTRGLAPNGALRPSRDEAPELYQESAVGWIPKEWEVATLSDKKCEGRAHLKTGPFGSSLKNEHWVETGHPVITIGALGEGEIVESELLFVNQTTAERLHEYQLDPGDVVFSRVADVGRSVVIGQQHKGWIMSSNLMRISLDTSKVLPGYLQAQLADDQRIRKQIRATVNAGGREVANSQILNRLKFVWPPPGEQALILERIEAVNERKRIEVTYREKLMAMRAGLMQDLLSGLVPVVSRTEEDSANV